MNASLQSFLTSYLIGCKNFRVEDSSLVLHDTYVLPIKFKSITGFHEYAGSIFKNQKEISFDELVCELTLLEDTNEDNCKTFIQRVKDSNKKIEQLLESKENELNEVTLKNNFNFGTTEQCLVFGHFAHPYPKLQEGASSEGKVSLKWFWAHKDIVHIEHSTLLSEEKIESLLKKEGDFILFPVHPIQLNFYQPFIEQGQMKESHVTDGWIPTTSFRTLFKNDSEWMLKFSLNVRLTNSLRNLLPTEVKRGMQLHEVLNSKKGKKALEEKDISALNIINEPLYLAIKDGNEILKETIVVYRENPFYQNENNSIPLATLNQYFPQLNTSLLRSIVKNDEGAKVWFNKFLDVAIYPFVLLQARHGLYLGAHQQNLILKLDANLLPEKSYYRDCQGTGYSQMGFQNFKDHSPSLNNPNGNVLPTEFANTLMGYYLFINSLLFTIKTLAVGNEDLENVLMKNFVVGIKKLTDIQDHSFIDYVLNNEHFLIKDNYECCVKNINENTMTNPLLIYKKFPNPFFKVNQHAL